MTSVQAQALQQTARQSCEGSVPYNNGWACQAAVMHGLPTSAAGCERYYGQRAPIRSGARVLACTCRICAESVSSSEVEFLEMLQF